MGDIHPLVLATPYRSSTAQVLHSTPPEDDELLQYQLKFLKARNDADETERIVLSPILMGNFLRSGVLSLDHPQYGLLAGVSRLLKVVHPEQTAQDLSNNHDPRVFFNVTTPSSTFICGSQGSGKSHTLSCLLENCLISSKLGNLPSPLTGVVFHYDTFISDDMGSPCEAAFLSSNPAVEVRVLCSPTNIRSIKGTYSRFGINVHPLEIDQKDLNTKRMLDLMAVESSTGTIPLYMHTVQRILREMRISQQASGSPFDYLEFKSRVLESGLTPGQLEPLKQRLETLESFMPEAQTMNHIKKTTGRQRRRIGQAKGTIWKPKPGCLTIVDLSCPCISPETACALFNICLGIFLEQDPAVGRIIALDEAHKYMNSSPESGAFTNSLLSIVRLQRHLGVRVIISTQEPTVSTALLNLCSTTIVHRFTSPEWLRILHRHLAAAAYDSTHDERVFPGTMDDDADAVDSDTLFRQIVGLHVGEALLFSPTAMIISQDSESRKPTLSYLGDKHVTIKIRARVTEDGGKSVLSS